MLLKKRQPQRDEQLEANAKNAAAAVGDGNRRHFHWRKWYLMPRA